MKVPIITDYVEKRAREKRSAEGFNNWIGDLLDSGGGSTAGVNVTAETAIQASAVFACIRLLSETMGSLPFPVYERTAGGRQKASDTPLYGILQHLPNPEMTSIDYRTAKMVNCLLWGVTYSEIERDRAGDVVGLWPIVTPRVTPMRRGGELFYEVSGEKGKKIVLSDKNVFRFSWVGNNGIAGYKPLRVAREIFATALATNKFSKDFFENGTHVSGVAEYPHAMSDTAYDRYKESVRENYEGLGKSHRLMFLEEGMKLTKLTTSPNEAQMLETRRFNVEEIARFFNVPPHMIQDLSRATFSNIEHQSISFAEYSVRPWAVRWEQAVYRDLIAPEDRSRYYAEMLLEGLMRGDTSARYQAYGIGRQWGWLSANDIRERENMPLVDGGDIYVMPMNMMPTDSVAEADKTIPAEEEEEAGQRFSSEQRGNVPTAKRRTAGRRARMVKANEKLFRDVGERIVRRESTEVLKAIKKAKKRDREFSLWVDEFYDEASDWIKRLMIPVAGAFSETVQGVVADETGGDVTEDMVDSMEEFSRSYSTAFSARYVRRHRGQLNTIMEEVDDEEELYTALEQRANDWKETEPQKVAMNETVQLSNAVAKTTMGALAVRRLMFINTGSKTCPFCEQLDGKVVGIDQPFVMAGDTVEADDGSGMEVHGPKLHPPIHQGCVCQIVAE